MCVEFLEISFRFISGHMISFPWSDHTDIHVDHVKQMVSVNKDHIYDLYAQSS